MVNKIVTLLVTYISVASANKRLLHSDLTDGSHNKKCLEWDYYFTDSGPTRNVPPDTATSPKLTGTHSSGSNTHKKADSVLNETPVTACTEPVPEKVCVNTDAAATTPSTDVTKCYRYGNGFMQCCTVSQVDDGSGTGALKDGEPVCATCAATSPVTCQVDSLKTILTWSNDYVRDEDVVPRNKLTATLTGCTTITPTADIDGDGTPDTLPDSTLFCTRPSNYIDRQLTYCTTKEGVGSCCTQQFKAKHGYQGAIYCTPITCTEAGKQCYSTDGHVEFTRANPGASTPTSNTCSVSNAKMRVCTSTLELVSGACWPTDGGSDRRAKKDCWWYDLNTDADIPLKNALIGSGEEYCAEDGCRTTDEDEEVIWDATNNECIIDGGPSGGLGAILGITGAIVIGGGSGAGLLFGGIIGGSGDGYPCDEWPTCIGEVPSAEYFLGPAIITILVAVILCPICYKCMKKDASYTFQLWALLPTIQNIVIILMRWMDDEDGNEYYSEVLTLRMFMVMVPILIWGIRLAMVHSFRHSFRGEDWRFKKMREEQEASGGMKFPMMFFFNFLFTAMANLVLNLPASYIGLMSVGVEDAFFFSDIIAIAIWAIGFIIEVVSDAQLTKHLKNPAPGAGKFLRNGMWKFSRHPNYFGEVLQWWGLWTFALGITYGGYITVLSPIMVTLMLAVKTPMMDVKYANDPEWQQYKKETSGFMPFMSKKTNVQVLGATATPTPDAAATKVEDPVAEEGGQSLDQVGQSQEIELVGRV